MLRKTALAVLLFSVTALAQVGTTRLYPIDNNHSTVGFSVPIMNGLSQVQGKFTDFAITVNNDEKDITKSSVNVTIKAASINTGIVNRDNHLRNADFFDVEKFPEITFQSSKIVKRGKQFIAHGTLTMHGVSKEIELPFTITGTEKNAATKKMTVGYSANLVVNRRDYGINYQNKNVPNFVGDNVEIQIRLITRALDIQ
jgi:polyisoprenoid-binding protein YceI